MANTALMRSTVLLLTNKSGGNLAQGEVVILDTANASAFTTTTTSGYVGGIVGVIIEPNGIANDASGLVSTAGYVPKINLSGSASLGDLFKTHSSAGQAVRHGAPVVTGDFGEVLGTGTSPEAILWGATAGAKGDTGSAGPKGDTGADSTVPGPQGDTGADSTVPGPKGDTGTTGGKGDTGATGVAGDTGSKGDTGSAGGAGSKGDTGSAGGKGDTGSKGDTGTAGSKGDTGSAGNKGDTGSAGAITREAIFTVEGALTVKTGTIRIYNKLGATVTISQVFVAVNTVPTGAAIIVDVHKNGTTIYTTQSHRPQVAASANSGYTTTIDVSSWADGDYLTMDVDQVGSTIVGSDLTVHVIYS